MTNDKLQELAQASIDDRGRHSFPLYSPPDTLCHSWNTCPQVEFTKAATEERFIGILLENERMRDWLKYAANTYASPNETPDQFIVRIAVAAADARRSS